MKIKIKNEDVKNMNDCWNVALSYALQTPYEDIRKLFKPFIESSGGLRIPFIRGVLLREGFSNFNMGETLTVKQVVKFLDSKHNHLIICIDNHVFYVDNKTIIDGGKELEEMLVQRVEEVFIKEK